MAKRATIADVAKASGVSPGTVSRVLNSRTGDIPISEATQKQVRKAAQKLGYEPNVFAAALRTDRTGVIGVVVRNVNEPIFSMLLEQLQTHAHDEGLDLLVGNAGYSLETAERQIKLMSSRLFDGVIVMGHMPDDNRLFDQLTTKQIPFVTLARGTQTMTPLVNVDEAAGTLAGLEYLYQLGHRRIAFIGSLRMAGVEERLETYQDFVRTHDLPVDESYTRTTAFNRSGAIQEARQLANLIPRPTAVFCAADTLALGAIIGFQREGIQIPDDISIIGFDNMPEGREFLPNLTTISQPVQGMAREAMQLLMERINSKTDETLANRRVILRPELVVRESCKALSETEET